MSETSIEWATHTLNFYDWHCNKVSEGCKFCYAETLAKKHHKTFEGAPNWRGANAYKELRAMKPGSVVFANSMSDTYHEGATLPMIHGVHNAAAYLRPDLTFLLLTKRPERALALAPHLAWPPNLWIGTSVETPEYLWRLDALLQIPAAGHFVSAEPLLEPLWGLYQYLRPSAYLSRNGMQRRVGLKWVIVGGESGDKRRYFDKLWAEQIRLWCEEAVVPFMFKQGSAFFSGQDRLLNGRTYDETPFGQIKAPAPTPEKKGEVIPYRRHDPGEIRSLKHAMALEKLAKWNAAVKGEQP
jgi:protein gp37